MSSSRQVSHEEPVWVGKPWIVPVAIIRTVVAIIVLFAILVLEAYFGGFSYGFVGLPLWAWTVIVFFVIWLLSTVSLLIFRLSNTYILRQDAIEVHRGIVRLHSFVVTPAGFGDLLVNQSLGGRIFGYGDILVNSQGERQTTLSLFTTHLRLLTTCETSWANQSFASTRTAERKTAPKKETIWWLRRY